MNKNNKEVRLIKLLKNNSFLTPTSRLKELLLLEHIETNPDTTQKEMAKAIKASPSMVNQYLNEYEDKEYIERLYESAKKVRYLIRPEGLKRKNYLSITYLHELLKMYNLAQENVDKFLKDLEDCGYRKILLYGAGEVAQIILEIINKREDNKIEILGLIDDDKAKLDKKILAYKTIGVEDIKDYDHDLILITSYTYEDQIMSNLKKIDYPEDRARRFFR